MKIAFILSLIVICVSFLIYLIFLRKDKNLKFNIFLAVLTCIISISILVFPFLDYDNLYIKAFASFIYAFRCIGLGQNLNILSDISLNSTLGYLYFILINVLFIALPALTVSFIVTYLERALAYIRFKFSLNNKVVVFSEINNKSLKIAKNIKKSCIVFTNVLDKTDLNIKAIKLSRKVNNIKFNNKSELTIYMISDNEDQNLIDTLELIEKYKNRDKTKIYVLNSSDEASTILDSTDNGKITVEIINEKEKMIFNLLNTKPLFLNTVNKTISILIVGCDEISKEFLKDSIWCGVIPGYKYRVLVVDENADKIKNSLVIDAPELIDNYDITFMNGDIKSKKVVDEIKSRKDINYIVISMDKDDKNIDTAIMLRRLFLREFDREPIINVKVNNKYKYDQVLKLSNEKNYSYNFNPFGNIDEIYSNNFNSDIEKLAIQLHLAYDKEDTDLKRYNLREYNKRSSRASVLHIKYKLFSVLGDSYTGDIRKDLEQFRTIYSSEIENTLVENEHNRWMAYMRSIGYINASINEVSKYYSKNNSYIHYLARKHPALVDFKHLDKVSKQLSIITNQKVDLKESDYMIIEFIYESIKL